MTVVTKRDGDLATQHPLAIRVYTFDYDAENLGLGVIISTNEMALTVIKGSNVSTPASIDSKSILAGNRKTSIRFIPGVDGTKYRVTNTVTTNETPAQTKVKYIDILVET